MSPSLLAVARILGGLSVVAGVTALILAPIVGDALFERLWGVEPLSYIGAVLVMLGLGAATLSYFVPDLVARRNKHDGPGQEVAEQWSQVTQQYFELFDHDLGRPLRRILGKERELRAVLQSADAEAAPGVKELLDEIERQTPSFRLMMSNIRVLVELEAPNRPVGLQPTEPSEVVRKIVDRYSPVAAESDKEITWWADPTEFGIVYSDSSAIEHIVTNLVDNAVRFASSQIEVKVTKNPSHFFIRVWEPGERPKRIRPRQLRYRPGVQALVCYAVEWRQGRWVVEDQFAIELRSGKSARLFRYPEDPYLPGLRLAASAVDAPELLSKFVRAFSPHRLRVETVRYRPATRAVLRHVVSWRRASTGNVTLFARVMRPRRVDRLLAAAELARHSGFNVPRVVGNWTEGGVVWMTKVPGDTVRALIRKGAAPDPERILGDLAKLWSLRVQPDQGHPFNLSGRFRTTERLLSQVLRSEEACHLLQQVTSILEPFSETWQPSALAHNDFYDDQLLLTPEGHLALVDFEEIGPGDPLLDVGKLLAHLRRTARFGNAREACETYRRHVRSVALARFGWDPKALDLREAIALFLLAPGPIRQLRRNWAKGVELGLALAFEVLEEPARTS